MAVALVGGWGLGGVAMPHVRRLPGPVLVVAVRFQASPIGPFTELAVIEPVRRGIHAGFSVIRSAVDDERARTSRSAHWGAAPELGVLRWIRDGDSVVVRWEEEGLDLRVEPIHRPLPVLVPMRLLQVRRPDPMIMRARIRGLMRVARVELGAPADGAFGPWVGAHRGALVAAPRIQAGPAVRPLEWGRWRERLAPAATGGVPLGFAAS